MERPLSSTARDDAVFAAATAETGDASPARPVARAGQRLPLPPLRPARTTLTAASSARPPRVPRAAKATMAQPPKKAACAADCERLEQLPNIGPALAADLRSIGVGHPRELAVRDGHALYRALCDKTGRRQDPCVLDTFLAVCDFMRGAPPAPWWTYTARRKATFGEV